MSYIVLIRECTAAKQSAADFAAEVMAALPQLPQPLLSRCRVYADAYRSFCYAVFESAAAPDQAVLKAACDPLGIDFFCPDQLADAAQGGVLAMDMDATAVRCEEIDEVARLYGVYDEVAAITQAAMNGKYVFKEAFLERIRLFKGFDGSRAIKYVMDTLPIDTGLDLLNRIFKHHGFMLGIISGGFTQIIARLVREYQLDFVRANTFDLDENGLFTGGHHHEVVDAAGKAQGLNDFIRHYRSMRGRECALSIAVGDGANDLKMIAAADFGFAYHAKAVVQEQARYCINHHDLAVIGVFFDAMHEALRA